jgi:mono/diheme cytochrome c family protein
MTRRAIATTRPVNRLYPPLGFRPLLAGWKMLFLNGGIWQPRNDRSAEWNRGAYLVEGFAHCGACHTPRNIAGGEIAAHAYTGGWAEGWYAPPINGQNPAARDWTIDSLYTYLRTGIDMNHTAAAGPMGPVTYNLARAPASDVHAIAVYVASMMGKTQNAEVGTAPLTEHPDAAVQDHAIGATLFAGACSGCHGPGAPMMTQGRPLLSLGSAVQEAEPRDVVQIILHGLKSPTGGSGPYMPAFADSFTDSQIAEIAGYLRSRYTDHPAWPKLREAVAEAREEGGQP